jgi:hypothetical protein
MQEGMKQGGEKELKDRTRKERDEDWRGRKEGGSKRDSRV